MYTKNHDHPLKYYECIQLLDSLVVQGFLPITAEDSREVIVGGMTEHIVDVAETLYHSAMYQQKIWKALKKLGIEPEFSVCDSILFFEEAHEKEFANIEMDQDEYVFLKNVVEYLSSR